MALKGKESFLYDVQGSIGKEGFGCWEGFLKAWFSMILFPVYDTTMFPRFPNRNEQQPCPQMQYVMMQDNYPKNKLMICPMRIILFLIGRCFSRRQQAILQPILLPIQDDGSINRHLRLPEFLLVFLDASHAILWPRCVTVPRGLDVSNCQSQHCFPWKFERLRVKLTSSQ